MAVKCIDVRSEVFKEATLALWGHIILSSILLYLSTLVQGEDNPQNFVLIILLSGAWTLIRFLDNWSLRLCLNMKSKRAGDWSLAGVDGSGLVPPGEDISYRELLWMIQNRCRSKAIMKWCGQPWVQCLRLLFGLALFSNIDIALEIWLDPSSWT